MHNPRLYYPGDLVLMVPHVSISGAEHFGILVPTEVWNELATKETIKKLDESLANFDKKDVEGGTYALRALVFGEYFCSPVNLYTYSTSPPNVKRFGTIFREEDMQSIWTFSSVMRTGAANVLEPLLNIAQFIHMQDRRDEKKLNGFQREHLHMLQGLLNVAGPREDYYRIR